MKNTGPRDVTRGGKKENNKKDFDWSKKRKVRSVPINMLIEKNNKGIVDCMSEINNNENVNKIWLIEENNGSKSFGQKKYPRFGTCSPRLSYVEKMSSFAVLMSYTRI